MLYRKTHNGLHETSMSLNVIISSLRNQLTQLRLENDGLKALNNESLKRQTKQLLYIDQITN